MANARIDSSRPQIEAFCKKWRVRELSLFGSILRDDFRPESDVDVLVVFEDGAPWSLWDWEDMRHELKAIFGRDVDLVEKDALRNSYRKRAILSSYEVIYAA